MVIDTFIEQISARCSIGAETYIDEKTGLRYCSHCRTPVEHITVIGGKELKLNCLCECKSNEIIAEEANTRKARQQMEIERNIMTGIRDERFRAASFAKSDTRLDTERAYAANWERMRANNCGIMFTGAMGGGKTYRAACIAMSLARKGVKVFMDNITAVCSAINTAPDRQEYINALCGYDLLILDDIGAERHTDYMIETVYQLIDTRYRRQKPLIITTNLTIAEMKQCEDIRLARTYDRLFEMCSYPIIVKDNDRRKTLANEKFAMMREILGSGAT